MMPEEHIDGEDDGAEAKSSLFRFEPTPGEQKIMSKIAASIRRRILAGALSMIPVLVALIPIWFLYPKLDALAQNTLKINVPGVGFAVAFLFVLTVLYIIGLLSATFLMKRLIALGERIVTQIPVVNFCYRIAKQVVDLVATGAKRPFKKVVAVEYPRKGILSLGFVTNEGRYPGASGPLVHVFIPTTPNPTSGFLLLLKAEEVFETGMTVDDAVRFIISGGILDAEGMALRPYQTESLDSVPAPAAPPRLEGKAGRS
jgi:uncharacterized membrane protein